MFSGVPLAWEHEQLAQVVVAAIQDCKRQRFLWSLRSSSPPALDPFCADPAPQALSFASRSSSADPSSPCQLHSSPTPGAILQIESLLLFRDVPVLECQTLFLGNQICSVLFDFFDTLKSAREKEVKRQTLSKLVDFVQSSSARLNEQMSPYDGAPEGFDQTIFSVRSDRSIGPVENFALNLVKDVQK
ncbi:hypothetical protein ZIOFF_017166 [Zingiber officinale]|uniref:Uncharacterized protein n=1 Tax=Zingiber officinale TaxID=94328 RepID=A0A8J5H4M7_ZINOF|nr:hypothetical protein ZIOFF_017166 [Zingiber officinale]